MTTVLLVPVWAVMAAYFVSQDDDGKPIGIGWRVAGLLWPAVLLTVILVAAIAVVCWILWQGLSAACELLLRARKNRAGNLLGSNRGVIA